MSKDYFGTDGVRGTVGNDPMTADFAMRLASAAAQVELRTAVAASADSASAKGAT